MIEADVKKAVKDFLACRGIHTLSTNKIIPKTGWYYMPMQNGMGTLGVPDFVGHYKGFFFAIETKAPGKKPTGLQALIGESINNSGAVWFVIDHPKKTSEVLEWCDMVDTMVDVYIRKRTVESLS